MSEFKTGDVVKYKLFDIVPFKEEIVMTIHRIYNPSMGNEPENKEAECKYFKDGQFHEEKFKLSELVPYKIAAHKS